MYVCNQFPVELATLRPFISKLNFLTYTTLAFNGSNVYDFAGKENFLTNLNNEERNDEDNDEIEENENDNNEGEEQEEFDQEEDNMKLCLSQTNSSFEANKLQDGRNVEINN
ncbi:hypothetical protein ABEB36_004231 [Hypothenemus hampei]|uniref:Uncharacterized protein n=1 Tax=Hypothenemus hampei TaxID=57062 RepID=A0ABD1F2Q5_HYPHA